MSRLTLHRRGIVQLGLAGLAAAVLPKPAIGNITGRGRARSCILLYMDGGPSHIDLLDLKPQAPADIRGPYQPLPTSVPGIQIGELMPLTARQMHRLLLVRSMRHDQTVHDPAVYQMLTGYKHVSSAGDLRVEETDLPHIACAVSQADRQPAALPRALHLPDKMKMNGRILPGQNHGILTSSYDSLQIDVSHADDVALPPFARPSYWEKSRLQNRTELLSRLTTGLQHLGDDARRLENFRQQAFELAAMPNLAAAFDLDREPDQVRDQYGRHRHGQSVLLARRLVEAGARFVTVYWGNEDQDWADGRGSRPANNPWDTHRNHFPLVKDSLAPRADQTLAALIDDLAERGLLSETLVVWMGDFGRTPSISRPWASRDHWPFAFSLLLAGGGLKAGEVFGSTDKHAAEVVDDPITPADLTATILEALGIDPATSIADAQGRPHRLSPGRIQQSWFA